jgi:asparagine synthase (glutamine-hydrolysing)
MCGVVAAFSKTKNFDKTIIENCLSRISHRGSDAQGYYFDNGVAMAHNRLAIVGNTGQQPLFSQDNSCVAIVNGEFYDYKDIKNKLKLDNYNFYTESDSEIVLPLYQKYGLNENFFKNLNGEFSAILFDKQKNQVIAFRDRFGINPLYYYKTEDSVYFASELKAFTPVDATEWNSNTLNSVLTMQYHSSDSTLLKNVHQVQAGSYLILDLNTMEITEKQYWDMNYQPEDISFEEAQYNLREALHKSVSRRIDVDKPLGVTLSGGIDSSVIYSLASQIANKPLDAFSLSFQNGGRYDELELAKEMCEKYNGNFNPVIVSEMDMLNSIEDATFHSEEVSVNSHLSAKYLLFKAMSDKGIKVSLSGEGADELLLGYPHFKLDMYNNSANQNANSYLSGLQTPDKDFLDTSLIKQKLGFVPKFLEAKYSMGYKLQNFVLNKSYVNEMFDPFADITKCLNIPKMENVYTSSYLWSKICLSNYILVALGDKMEMASTIEGRVPFLDNDVYNAVRNMPTNFKMNKDSVEKYILKETFKNDITSSIYNKQKHPFVAPPLLGWGNTNDGVLVRLMDILNSQSMKNHMFFDVDKIKKMILNINNQSDIEKAKFDPIVMLILTLHYFEKNFIK